MRKTILLICLGLALPLTASARRTNPLEGQPAVRHRFELRKGRFELGPAFDFTLNRYLRHNFLVGLKLDYHITDWIGIGATIGYGLPGMNTGLADELKIQFDAENATASWEKLRNRFTDIQLAGDVRVAFTPFSGKIAIFSKLFMAYDMYAFAGFGYALMKTVGSDYGATADDNIEAATKGFRPGAAWGFGVHLFFARFFSMGLEVKDYLFMDNPDGGDFTRGLTAEEVGKLKAVVNADDLKFSNHFLVAINFTFYLPAAPEISR